MGVHPPPCPGSSVQSFGATEQKSIPFLDTKLYIEGEQITTYLYRNPTDKDVNVFIFLKNDRFVMTSTTKNRKRNDRF